MSDCSLKFLHVGTAADARSIAVRRRSGAAPGLFSYDPFGNLAIGGKAFPSNGIPISVDPSFRTPHTN